MPKVSVIIPCYNHAAYIADTVNSVLSQSFTDFELLIADDCSSDNSREILRAIKDSRVKCIFPEKNMGTVRVLNSLIAASCGEYIATLGSDDIWQKDKLQKQVDLLDGNPDIGACFSWVDIIDENGNPTDKADVGEDTFNADIRSRGELLRRFYDTGNCICHSSALVRRSVQDAVGLYNPALRQLHDYELWVRIANRYLVKILCEKLVKYRRAVLKNGSVSATLLDNTVRHLNEIGFVTYELVNGLSEDAYFDGFCGGEKRSMSKAEFLAVKYELLNRHTVCGKRNCEIANTFLFNNCSEEFLAAEDENGISLADIYARTAEQADKYYFNDPALKSKNPVNLAKRAIKKIIRSCGGKV